MDNIKVSRGNHKKANKENAPPAYGFIKNDKRSAAPLQLKTVQRGEKMAAAPDFKQRHKQSQKLLTEQVVKEKTTVTEAPEPPGGVSSSKPAPGMYKGKIVQSKIGCIWKSSASVDGTCPKPAAPKPEGHRVGTVPKVRSKFVSDLPGRGPQKNLQTKSKSVLHRSAQVSKPTVTSRPPAGSWSACPPAKTIPVTVTSTTSRNTSVASTKRSVTQNSKPKIPVTDKKVNKPPVSSTLSQYRCTKETAEEKRAKLADWLASKGKALKRPAMTAAPPKTKVPAKPEADPKPESQPAAECKSEPCMEAEETNSAAHISVTQEAELITRSQTPEIMNTTLDLLENSDADQPVVQQESVDDIVLNLCDVLEAMATPSKCSDEISQVTDGEETDEQSIMETSSQMEGASSVKYSVKTTPYLQSVKRVIVSKSTSKKSNIKDLKFLTPVRRSCRLERKSSRLPRMLLDHDPCVSSLAELLKMDDNPNAYICRKNPALLADLPDQSRV